MYRKVNIGLNLGTLVQGKSTLVRDWEPLCRKAIILILGTLVQEIKQ